MAKTYDPKCWELARLFLSDVPHATNDDIDRLAQDLQRVAEDAVFCLDAQLSQGAV